jgi:predicted PurR-regulated permease PerM
VMLYLAFFLLRDGDRLSLQIGSRIPLLVEHKIALSEKFATVIRATIKGSLVVAMVQGMIGGVIFWVLGVEAALLGGVAMGFFSLLPAIGTGLIWVPVAIYLLATGALWQGLVLIFCGLFVIGMVDNVLRPILVGKETRMPDYIVLISTLGGLSIFGINGFILGPVIAALFMAAWDIFGRANAPNKEATINDA